MAVDLDSIYRELQEIFRHNPMLVVGSGSSAATGSCVDLSFPTMQDLAAKLREVVPDRLAGKTASLKAWSTFDALLDSYGLEEALQQALITDTHLLEQLVRVTAELVEEVDLAFRNHLLVGDIAAFPLQRLVEYLFESVPAAYPVVNVLTPNYDRLIEYACFASRIPCSTCFFGFGISCFDPGHSASAMTELRCTRKSRFSRPCPTAHVALFKPHGSLGWYQSQTEFVELHDPDLNLPRIMVTPGATKYERSLTLEVLNHHREAANRAMKSAQALVFYGYGFNDAHLQTTLASRLAHGVPTIILTAELTPAAKKIAETYPHVWAFDQGDNNSARCIHQRQELTIDEPVWELHHFLSSVLGR